jgi:hypothetical protein
MRFALIIGRTYDDRLKIVDGPANPMELNRKFKQFMCRKENADYMEMYLHEIQLSGGRKRASFAKPKDETYERIRFAMVAWSLQGRESRTTGR